jgi:hypothetical protein
MRMIPTEDLIADWITIRATLKRQLDQLKSANGTAGVATETVARLKTCLSEIEALLRSNSSRR